MYNLGQVFSALCSMYAMNRNTDGLLAIVTHLLKWLLQIAVTAVMYNIYRGNT